MYAWLHVGRPVRLALLGLLGVIAVAVFAVVVTLQMHAPASDDWTRFSIGPASGRSAHIGTNNMWADGITLKAAVATAFDVPAVRIIGPDWLADTRYSINAVLDLDSAESFRSLLLQELQKRLRLETHREMRSFDVFVLTAAGTPRLERASGSNLQVRLSDSEAQLKDASMERLAGALQGVLGRPVIDETGIRGVYNLQFGWTEDRVASVTATLRDRFGLQLSPEKREMEALIIDHIRRDPALVLLGNVGRITRRAPSGLRRHIAEILTIR